MEKIKVPIIFIIYNRPATTQKVLSVISQYKPEKLYVIADGPKDQTDVEKCEKTRKLLDSVDWDCEIIRNISDINLGCRKRVSSGITWAFESCDRAIIFEDDCVPDLSFFRFCEEMLENYKDDMRIGMISGDQFLEQQELNQSYYFSNFPHIWGWATWRRAWQNYDELIKEWPKFRKLNWLTEKTGAESYANAWMDIFDRVYAGQINSWAYQVAFMLWTQNQLSIAPKYNLISNIGFGADSTHTKDPTSIFSLMSTKSLEFPLVHPKLIYRDLENDLLEAQQIFGTSPRSWNKITKSIKNYLRHVLKGS